MPQCFQKVNKVNAKLIIILFNKEKHILIDMVRLSVRSSLFNIIGRVFQCQCFVEVNTFTGMRESSGEMSLLRFLSNDKLCFYCLISFKME